MYDKLTYRYCVRAGPSLKTEELRIIFKYMYIFLGA